MSIKKRSSIDLGFRTEISSFPEGETVNLCYQCGTCTGACPSAKFVEGFNPRRMMDDVLLGFKERLISSSLLWTCSLCHTCHERCPQGVHVSHILILLKNLAAKEKNIPEGLKKEAAQIINEGLTVPVGDAILRRRRSLNLPEMPYTVGVDEIREIVKTTHFDQLVDFKWKEETKEEKEEATG